MKQSALLIVLGILAVTTVRAVDLVKDGKPVAEIVVSKNATNFQTVAAQELQRHLEKISGAKLAIVNEPSSDVPNKVYVGESEFTKKLDFSLDDVKRDGFKIVAEGDHVILAGHDIDNISGLLGKIKTTKYKDRQKQWNEITGENWRTMCATNFYDYNEDLGLYLQDGTGTMYAVYELLKQLGMRWYMPVEEIGIVYPELKNVVVEEQSTKMEPEFPVRIYTDPRMGAFKKEFFWYKAMKMGSSENVPVYHSIGRLAWHKKFDEMPEEYFGMVNGKRHHTTPNLNGEKFRKDFIRYLDKTVEAYPDLDYICIGQPDGWLNIDDKDKAAGWDKMKERGPRGRFTDLHWKFIMDMYEILKEKYPDKKYTVFAYGTCTRPPTNMKEIPEDIVVSFCESIPKWRTIQPQNEEYRDEWQKLLTGDEQMIIWEHYLQNNKGKSIPTFFAKDMKRSFDKLYGKSKGIMAEVGWNSTKVKEATGIATSKIGLTHPMYLLHAELCWNKNLDVEAFFNEYYQKFFGPAADEMKAFYEFVEEVWNRPGPRTIVEEGGWLNKADVANYFSLLAKAKEKAGDTVYRKRIEYIEKDLEPLKQIHDRLKRTGLDVKCYQEKGKKPVIDGDIDEPFWRDREFSFYRLRDMITGEIPNHVETKASFRWIHDQKEPALAVAVECSEPNMDKLADRCEDRDSMGIFSDDFVEVQLVTQAGINPKIVVTPKGSVYDECATEQDADLPLSYTIENVAVKRYPDRWTVEMKIPANQISGAKPTKNYPWGVNVSRQRMAGNEPDFFMLSPSGVNFKDKQCMANLRFPD